MQEQKQKVKAKKTYAELLEEFSNTRKKIAVIYVPLLCEAMRDENPTMAFSEIKEKVVNDAVDQGWNYGHITRCLPSWLIEDDPHHKRQVKAYETRNQNKLKTIREKFILNTQEIPEPPAPKEREISEETDEQLTELGMARIGETGKTISALYGDITESAAALFKALTGKYYMPNEDEDLTTEYIKPTREFRRGLALDLDEKRKTTLHNWLHYTSAAIEDMIAILDKS